MKSFRNLVEAKMSRQHFQLIADVIAGLDISTTIKKTIAEKFADAFEDTNPMFKRDLFIKATRVKTESLEEGKLLDRFAKMAKNREYEDAEMIALTLKLDKLTGYGTTGKDWWHLIGAMETLMKRG